MYFRANLRNWVLPDLLVFLDEDKVALSSKRVAVVATVQSASNSPNNLKSHAGPSEEKI